MGSESKDQKGKLRSLHSIFSPLLITTSILFLLLAVFVVNKELLDKWDEFFGSTVLSWAGMG